MSALGAHTDEIRTFPTASLCEVRAGRADSSRHRISVGITLTKSILAFVLTVSMNPDFRSTLSSLIKKRAIKKY